MSLNSNIEKYLESLNARGLLRQRQVRRPATTAVFFDSNDYLSLSTQHFVAQAYQQGYACFPSGSTGSMLLSGYHPNHQAVEEAFAQALKVDGCILFSSGYAANLAIAALLAEINATCYIDKYIHASFYDGLHLSKTKYARFLHNDVDSLSRQLGSAADNAVIITEGLFSMSGQLAPLVAMKNLMQDKIPLIVDESHSFGIYGPQGLGLVALHQLTSEEVPLRIISLGKACAAQGAIIAGKKAWLDALLQAGRSIIYSTAISPALSYGLLKTLDGLLMADERRERLFQRIAFFQEQVVLSSLPWNKSNSAIQFLHLGCPHRAVALDRALKAEGYYCSAVRVPTVSKQKTGLRIVLNCDHTEEQIRLLFKTIHRLYEHSLCN